MPHAGNLQRSRTVFSHGVHAMSTMFPLRCGCSSVTLPVLTLTPSTVSGTLFVPTCEKAVMKNCPFAKKALFS